VNAAPGGCSRLMIDFPVWAMADIIGQACRSVSDTGTATVTRGEDAQYASSSWWRRVLRFS